MSDEYSFSTARARLEEIVTQVRKKDTSLEKSLDLLEEGVRLANACTELIDHADWTVGGVGDASIAVQDTEGATGDADAAVVGPEVAGETVAVETDDMQGPTSGDVESALVADGAPSGPQATPDETLGEAADEAWADDASASRDDES